MKHVKLFEQFINEANDNTIGSLIDAVKTFIKMGALDNTILNNVKDDFIKSIEDALKPEIKKLPTDKRKEFQGYVDSLIIPLDKANTLSDFIKAMASVANTKNNIISKISIEEEIKESKIIDWLKSAKNKTVDWWRENRLNILLLILEILAQIIVELLFAILRALLKSDNLDAPKIKFRDSGGASGGGGAGGIW